MDTSLPVASGPRDGGDAIVMFFQLRDPGGLITRCLLYRTEEGLNLRLETDSLPAERSTLIESHRTAQELASWWRKELLLHRHYSRLEEPLRDR